MMALKASMREDVMRVILKMVPECLCGRLGFEEHMSLMHIKIAVRIIKVSWKNALDKNKAIFMFKTKQPKESTYVSCLCIMSVCNRMNNYKMLWSMQI